MGQSGIEWVDALYDWYVISLFDMADLIGVTYEEINVWGFCILLPSALIASIGLNIALLGKGRRKRRGMRTRRPIAAQALP